MTIFLTVCFSKICTLHNNSDSRNVISCCLVCKVLFIVRTISGVFIKARKKEGGEREKEEERKEENLKNQNTHQ